MGYRQSCYKERLSQGVDSLPPPSAPHTEYFILLLSPFEYNMYLWTAQSAVVIVHHHLGASYGPRRGRFLKSWLQKCDMADHN